MKSVTEPEFLNFKRAQESIQVIQVGVSLEMSHSWWRVGVLYLVGVLSGNTLPDSHEPVFINIVLNDTG
jgi:hypothetical protein